MEDMYWKEMVPQKRLILLNAPYGFKPIHIGDYVFSVQGSEYHYCTPRLTGLGPDQYSALELALWRKDHKGRDFMRPDAPFPHYYRWRQVDQGIASWVPVEEVQEMYQYLLGNPVVTEQKDEPMEADDSEVVDVYLEELKTPKVISSPAP